jgi:L-ascorbate metabolism protein UlaG (beta-lactamase superfamily)
LGSWDLVAQAILRYSAPVQTEHLFSQKPGFYQPAQRSDQRKTEFLHQPHERKDPFVDITWYGLSCFRIREGGVTIICDPFDKKVAGLTLPRLKADIVTISHNRPGHNCTEIITGDPKVINGPGEYEVKNVSITGLTTYHKAEGKELPERNVAYFFDFDGFTVGHLGDLGQIPQQRQVEDLGEIDVLLVPVSGRNTLDAARITEVISLLEPKIVVPMHYRHRGLAGELAESLEPVDKFLKELGISEPITESMLKLTKTGLPEETQVILLEPSTS